MTMILDSLNSYIFIVYILFILDYILFELVKMLVLMHATEPFSSVAFDESQPPAQILRQDKGKVSTR